MPARRVGINLLPKTEFELSYWGRILKWAITTGRYILILVELVVIMAFLSRFKLDKDLADLADGIAGKKAVLEASYATEQNFRLVQARLNAVGGLLHSQIGAKQILDTVTGYLPPDTTLIQLGIDAQTVQISGSASSQAGLAVFLSRMTADRTWRSIQLNDVVASPTEGIKFSIFASR